MPPLKRLLIAAAVILPIGSLLALGLWRGPDRTPEPASVASPTEALAAVDYDGHSFCGHEYRLAMQAQAFRIAKWPDRRITWTVSIDGARIPLNAAQVRDAFAAAWSSWAKSIDIEPVYTGDESKALVRSRFGVVVDEARRPDGPGRVLAWSELPDGTRTPRHQLYDEPEPWGVFPGNVLGKIDLLRVATHEIGHVLGLEHDTQNADAIMRPAYSGSIREPRPRDVQRLRALGYGAPTSPPPPAPSEPVGGWVITIRGTGPVPKVEAAPLPQHEPMAP